MKTNQTQEDLELRLAQDRLDAAKRRVVEADAKKLQAAKEALQREHDERELKVYEQGLKRREIEAKWAQKKAEDAAKELEARNAEAAKQRALEAEFGRLEEAKRQRQAKEDAIKKLDAAAWAAEQEISRIQGEAASLKSIKTEELILAGTEDVEYSGLPTAAGGLENADPENWGSPLLRNLLRRPAVANKAAAVIEKQQAPEVPCEAPNVVRLKKLYSEDTYENARRYVLESPISKLSVEQEIENWLKLNARPVAQ